MSITYIKVNPVTSITIATEYSSYNVKALCFFKIFKLYVLSLETLNFFKQIFNVVFTQTLFIKTVFKIFIYKNINSKVLVFMHKICK